MKCAFDISKAYTLIISAEKMMYGVVHVRISRYEKGLRVSYVAIADGGDVCGEGTNECENKSLKSVFRHILDCDYPDVENEESSYSWGIQIGDGDNKLITKIVRNYWGDDSLLELLSCIEDEIGSCEAINALRDLMEF